MDHLFQIERARRRIRDHVVSTPCSQIRDDVWLKREDLQIDGSFKARGVWNIALSAAAEAQLAGIVCVSSGNTGRAVCTVARKLGCPAYIFTTTGTIARKLDLIREAGGRVIVGAESFAETGASAQAFAESRQMVFCSPGQSWPFAYGVGTVGCEIVEQVRASVIYVPVGGGGLATGVGLALEVLPTPERPRLIGVQSSASPFVYEHFHFGKISSDGWSQSVADCLVGDLETDALILDVAHQILNDVVLVDDRELIRAQATLRREGIDVEVGAAAGYAALLKQSTKSTLGFIACVIVTGSANHL